MVPTAIPEKTIEHWVSQYITYRFRSLASLWWPVSGEDVSIESLPRLPSKVLQLELKTASFDPATPEHQTVNVDLAQLAAYVRKRHWEQPYYVYPIPDWDGTLQATAARFGRSAPESAYRRAGTDWWFGDWTHVAPTSDVVHATRHRGRHTAVLASSTRQPDGSMPPAGELGTSWPNFWSAVQRCGTPGWPGIVRVPALAPALRGQRYVNHRTMAQLLGLGALWDGFEEGQPMAAYGSNGEGFELLDDAAVLSGPETDDEPHRAVVALPLPRPRRPRRAVTR